MVALHVELHSDCKLHLESKITLYLVNLSFSQSASWSLLIYSRIPQPCEKFREAWWSRGSVPASGPPGPGSNLGQGPPHRVV